MTRAIKNLEALDNSVLTANVSKLITIVDYLNEIKQQTTANGIIDADSLGRDAHIMHSMLSRAQKSYELAASCIFIRNRDKYHTARAELTHIEETLKKEDCIGGFDTITNEQLWEYHFGEDGHLNKVWECIVEVYNNSKIYGEVEKQCHAKYKQPSKLVTDDDLEHHKVITSITDPINHGVVIVVMLLNLFSANGNVPEKAKLYSLAYKLHPLKEHQFEYIISELERLKIIAHSENNEMLFIVNHEVCHNTARDYIDKNGAEELIKVFGGNDE